MSDTPETDKAWREFIIEGSAISTLRPLCEKLERERDKLRAEIEELKDDKARLARFEIDGAFSYLTSDLVIQHQDPFAAMALTFAKLNSEIVKLRLERDDYKERLESSVSEIQRLNIVNRALDESTENDQLRAKVAELEKDKARLDWLESQARQSRTGISFDWIPKSDGEPSGFRFMKFHHIGNPSVSLRKSIDSETI